MESRHWLPHLVLFDLKIRSFLGLSFTAASPALLGPASLRSHPMGVHG